MRDARIQSWTGVHFLLRTCVNQLLPTGLFQCVHLGTFSTSSMISVNGLVFIYSKNQLLPWRQTFFSCVNKIYVASSKFRRPNNFLFLFALCLPPPMHCSHCSHQQHTRCKRNQVLLNSLDSSFSPSQ